ncbi:MAG: helix-turn-helix domain-containing protein [Bacteroidota bacterium]
MKRTNRKIVDFINSEWLSQAKSLNSFAVEHSLDEKTVRRIKNDPNYTISLDTIGKLCEARNIKLSEFYNLVGL